MIFGNCFYLQKLSRLNRILIKADVGNSTNRHKNNANKDEIIKFVIEVAICKFKTSFYKLKLRNFRSLTIVLLVKYTIIPRSATT